MIKIFVGLIWATAAFSVQWFGYGTFKRGIALVHFTRSLFYHPK